MYLSLNICFSELCCVGMRILNISLAFAQTLAFYSQHNRHSSPQHNTLLLEMMLDIQTLKTIIYITVICTFVRGIVENVFLFSLAALKSDHKSATDVDAKIN